jgi:hypothetical protein
MLLGELRRWDLADDCVAGLPRTPTAPQWIEHFGDRDGDGYVGARRSPIGLVNQG